MRKTLYFAGLFIALTFVSAPGFAADADVRTDTSDTAEVVDADTNSDVDGNAADTDANTDVEDTASDHDVPKVDPPEDIGDTVELVEESVSLADQGAWIAFVVVLIQILMFVVKRLKATKWVIKRHGTAVVISLSAVASVLTLVVQGSGVLNAVLVFVTSSGSKFIHDLLHTLNVISHRESKDEDE